MSITRKIFQYHRAKGRQYQGYFACREEIVFSTIVTAPDRSLAAYEALYEYFSLRQLEQRGMNRTYKPLSLQKEMAVDLAALDLAESALRRSGLPTQVLFVGAKEWDPLDWHTVHYTPFAR